MATAVVFPGQGSQRAGMARDFHDADADARGAFEEASEALRLDVAALCFADADERLDLTEFAQPAILTVEIAMLRFLRARGGFAPERFGGHSLGEYTALVAAGVMSLAQAVRLVRERGRLMQAAVPLGAGGMTAIVARGRQGEVGTLDVAGIAAAADAVGVDVANHNARDQVVISGLLADLEPACESVHRLPGHERVRALPLRVSAPFHCRHMEPVERTLVPLLGESAGTWDTAGAAHVTSNCDGGFHAPSADAIVSALGRQASSRVHWLDNMRALSACSDRVVELGPRKPLAAFFATEGVAVESVVDLASAERLLAGA